MPEITRFYGVVIRMYFQQTEHNPPHIHVFYGNHAAAVEIRTCRILEGILPSGVFNHVRVWIEIHREELQIMWDKQEFKKLPPLE